MRGSGAFRTSVAPGGALAGPWVSNPLWRNARAVPSLDLCFADTKSLVCGATGQNRITHTRASSATFVDSSGVLQRAVTNLKTFSDAILVANNYGATNSTLTTVSIATPSGGTTASLFTLNVGANTGNKDGFYLGTITLTNLTQHTQSLFVKPASATVLRLRSNISGLLADFTLTGNGTAPSLSAELQGASIVPFPNGWYRVSWTFTTTTSAPGNRSDYWTIKTNVADGTNGLYVVGAQLEQASTVGEYVPTTSAINSAPRFDHNPTTGESLGLLVEEARTNSIRNNTMVGAVAGTPGTAPTNWAVNGVGTLSQQIVGTGIVDGINYIDIRLSGTTSTTQVGFRFETSNGATGTNGQTFTHSCWFARVAGSSNNITAVTCNANLYDAATAYITSPGFIGFDSATNPTSFIRRAGTLTIASATSAFIQPQIVISFNSGVAIDATFRIGLPQLEQGAFATSVIPTTSATVTRAADVPSITGSNFGTTRTNLLLRSEEFDNASWTKTNSSVTQNAVNAPNGILAADKLIESATTGFHYANQAATVISGAAITTSVYAKSAERSRLGIFPYSSASGARFNLANGTVISQDSGVTATITPVGDGWYRCSASITAPGTSASPWLLTVNDANATTYTGDDTSGLYIWGAQLETGSAATPYIPSTTTFTSRASGASYFDAAGVLQWKPQNLLVRSEEFDNASWQKNAVTVSADAAISPNGTQTADKIQETAASNFFAVIQNPAGAFSTAYTWSCYAKASERNFLAINFSVSGLSGTWNLTTGVNNIAGGTSTAVFVGNGWWRLSVTFTTPASGSNILYHIFGPSINNTTSPYAGTAGSGIFLWGAQLEQNSGSFTVPGEYTPTVATATGGARNSAFLPDSSGVFRSAGPLLLEEARTNVVQQSEAFSTGWLIGGFNTSTAAITSPSGQSGVSSANEVSTADSQHLVAYLFSIPGSTPYTFSFFAKANQRNNIALRYYYADNNWVTRVFDLSGSGEITQSSTGASADVTNISATIISCPNGWYRISLTLTQPATRSAYFSIDGCTTSTPTLVASSGIQVYTGDVNKGYYLWGAQEEAGSFPSSYIPTTTSAVTRAADVSTSTATSVFESSWYNQTEGTVFTDCSINYTVPGTLFPVAASLFDGTTNNRIENGFLTSTLAGYEVVTGGVAQVGMYPNAGNSLTRRLATSFKFNDFAASVNGGIINADTSGTIPTIDRLRIGGRAGGGETSSLFGTIRRLTYWPVRLQNNVLQQITQP